MGEIKQGILGGFSGKVGTVIGSSWKNVNYMRALAISVKNPRTEKQQHQRAKFALCFKFLQAFTPYIRVSYQTSAIQCTTFNAAMSYLLSNAVSGTGTDLSIDYNRVMVARGTLQPVHNDQANLSGTTLSLQWEDNSGQGDAQADDLAMPLVYNKVRGEAIYQTEAATRADGKLELSLPDNWSGEALAVYLAFRSEEGKNVSNSHCLLNDAYEGDSDSDSTSSGNGSTEDDDENLYG